MDWDPSDEDVAAAFELADVAIAGVDAKLTDAEREALRDLLLNDFLFTEHGRLELKAFRQSPTGHARTRGRDG